MLGEGVRVCHYIHTSVWIYTPRGGSRIFEKGGGSILGLPEAKRGGGSRRGFNFVPNVKKPLSWPRKGGPGPWTPSPPGSAHDTHHQVITDNTLLQVHLFLSRLSGAPIGLTALNMFVIDKPTILTVSISFKE